MTSKILFLDVDGPLIPSGMYAIDPKAMQNRTFSPIAVALVRNFCEKHDIKIVMNTMHNKWPRLCEKYNAVFTVKDDLVRAGIPEELFHESWQTNYGIDENLGRYDAIKLWQTHRRIENFDIDIVWVCFDDAEFLKKDHYDRHRLILIDFNHGITPNIINSAEKVLNLPASYYGCF
jgi:hypothetical protein